MFRFFYDTNFDVYLPQVSYQLKILTTAIFAVIILRKKLLITQWVSLLILIVGVAIVQLSNLDAKKGKSGHDQNPFIGFGAVLTACTLSGFAGIYFEKMLKGADISVWMRNIQLSLLSLPFAAVTSFTKDWNRINDNGFFFGYDWFVCYLVVLQACGGLLVALVVKHADNILKGFATSIAIVITCVASMIFFEFVLTLMFVGGASLVIVSIFLYGYLPKAKTVAKTVKTPATPNAVDLDVENGAAEKEEFLPKV